jgi:hypothetical protein
MPTPCSVATSIFFAITSGSFSLAFRPNVPGTSSCGGGSDRVERSQNRVRRVADE